MKNDDILSAYSSGTVSLITAATILEIDPPGILALMRAAGLAFPKLDEELIEGPAQASFAFFRETLNV